MPDGFREHNRQFARRLYIIVRRNTFCIPLLRYGPGYCMCLLCSRVYYNETHAKKSSTMKQEDGTTVPGRVLFHFCATIIAEFFHWRTTFYSYNVSFIYPCICTTLVGKISYIAPIIFFVIADMVGIEVYFVKTQ